MILHILGDIGQPLHNSSLVENYFNDAGENKIFLNKKFYFKNIDKISSALNNLHKIWDGALGLYSEKEANNILLNSIFD